MLELHERRCEWCQKRHRDGDMLESFIAVCEASGETAGRWVRSRISVFRLSVAGAGMRQRRGAVTTCAVDDMPPQEQWVAQVASQPLGAAGTEGCGGTFSQQTMSQPGTTCCSAALVAGDRITRVQTQGSLGFRQTCCCPHSHSREATNAG